MCYKVDLYLIFPNCDTVCFTDIFISYSAPPLCVSFLKSIDCYTASCFPGNTLFLFDTFPPDPSIYGLSSSPFHPLAFFLRLCSHSELHFQCHVLQPSSFLSVLSATSQSSMSLVSDDPMGKSISLSKDRLLPSPAMRLRSRKCVLLCRTLCCSCFNST